MSEDQRCIEFPPYGAPYLDAVASDPAALQVSIILSYLGSGLFVIGLLGLVHVVRGRGVLAHVAGAIAVFGYIGLTALFWTGVYDLAIAQHAPLSLGVRVWDAPESYFSAYVLLIPRSWERRSAPFSSRWPLGGRGLPRCGCGRWS